jgi:flagellar basal-body rod protein FlgG
MLFSALYTSNTGVQAASGFLDTVSNNIANADTVGFKTAQVSFQDLLYSGLATGANTPGLTPPGGTQLGNGAAIASTTGLFTQGALTPSNGPVSLAINGQGFFAVTMPNGTTGFTRAGNFTLDGAGHIVTGDGFILAGITVPTNTSAVSVSSTGAVSATTPTGVVPVGQLQLTQFQNPGGLTRIGDTTFIASPASGAASTGNPGSGNLGTINQGFLEQSNVDLSTELVNLIVAQQAFAFNSQAISAANQTLQDTDQILFQPTNSS